MVQALLKMQEKSKQMGHESFAQYLSKLDEKINALTITEVVNGEQTNAAVGEKRKINKASSKAHKRVRLSYIDIEAKNEDGETDTEEDEEIDDESADIEDFIDDSAKDPDGVTFYMKHSRRNDESDEKLMNRIINNYKVDSETNESEKFN